MALFKAVRHQGEHGLRVPREAFNVVNHIEYAWLGGDTGSAAQISPVPVPTALSLVRRGRQFGWRSGLYGSKCLSEDGLQRNPPPTPTGRICKWSEVNFLAECAGSEVWGGQECPPHRSSI